MATDDSMGLDPAECAAIAAGLEAVLPPSIAHLFDAAFIRSSFLYEEFIDRLTLRVFRASGLEAAAREPGGAGEIGARAGLEPVRSAVPLDWILRRLTGRGLVEQTDGGAFRVGRPLPDPDPGPVREAQRHLDPSWLPAYGLAETVARDYPAFLRGQTAGEEILFAPPRLRLWVDYFSNDNRLYAVNNRVGAVAVDEWMPAAGGTILELGGGLGSGALAVLERLEATKRLGAVGEYRFTERVLEFLRRGERVLMTRFPGQPPLRSGRLDMDRPFAEQGVTPGSVAVVYAVNTLHVADDLAFTLKEVRRTLAPGGRLILSECVRPLPGRLIYPEFVFNVMETFRAPRLHPAYRPNGGFLTPEQWARAIEAAGFVDVRWLPDIAQLRHRFPMFTVAAMGATSPGPPSEAAILDERGVEPENSRR
jgi:SAM-dependent methyltransferase